MKAAARTAALVTGAVALLVGPIVAIQARGGPGDPRIRVGAVPPVSLLPGDVRDGTARMIAAAVWTGLTSADPGTPGAAESVTSPDRRVWTVRLRAGGRFQDGSPVTAASFTGAWTAVVREKFYGARLFTDVARVKGARDVAKNGRIEGLKVKDDRTFEVTLDRPFGGFPLLLAEPAFMPIPESTLRTRDWTSYGQRPIGNGPLRITARTSQEITLARGGQRGGQRDIVIKLIEDAKRQYAEAGTGDLDVATQVPGSRHEAMDKEFRGRHMAVPGRTMTYLAFPLWEKRYSSTTLRQALSLAINRGAISDEALGYQASPADSLIPPGITLGRRTGQCRRCVYDPAAAAAALKDAGGLTGPVNIWYDPAYGETWLQTLVRQWRKDLKLDIRLNPSGEYAKALDERDIDGPFVVHTTADYASPVAALTSLMEVPTGYKDDYTTDLIDQANDAPKPQDAVIPARLAESSLLRDLPLIPLWSDHDHLVWSKRVRGVSADAFGGLRLTGLRVTG